MTKELKDMTSRHCSVLRSKGSSAPNNVGQYPINLGLI